MNPRVTLAARPSQLRLDIHRQGYLVAGAAAAALLLSGLSNNALVLAGAGSLGLFLLGELYTVTLRLREFTTDTEIDITPVSGGATAESPLRISLSGDSESLDPIDAVLSVQTETNSETVTATPPTELQFTPASGDSQLVVGLSGRVDSPESVCSADLTTVDTEIPLDEFDRAEQSRHGADVTSFEQPGREPDSDSDSGANGGESESDASSTEYDGLREYVTGDPFSHVDWKASARRNTLHVREFARERTPTKVVLLDLPSLSRPAWQAGVTVCREHLGHASSSTHTVIGVVRPSGKPWFDTNSSGRDPEMTLDQILRVARAGSDDQSEPSGPPNGAGATQPIRQRTEIGKMVTTFHKQANGEKNSLRVALRRARRLAGGTPSVSLVTGTRTTRRTASGIEAESHPDGLQISVLTTPDASDPTAALQTAVEPGVEVSVTERPLHPRDFGRGDGQQSPEYELSHQDRSS